MKSIVIFLNRFFDVLWSPFSRTPNYLAFILISAMSAFIFLVIFQKLSNQGMIRRYKNRMIAHILEIRLYKDQPIRTVKSILNILWCNMAYLRYTLVPMAVVFLPLFVMSVQVNNRYGYSPLNLDEPFIISVDLDTDLVHDIDNIQDKIRCETSQGILVETPPMRIESEAKVLWRGRLVSSGENQHFLRIALDGTDDMVEKKIVTSRANRPFSPERRKWQLGSIFVSNAENFITETSLFETVSVNYKRAAYPFLAWNIDPIVLYFILTLLFGFAFRCVIKVDI